MFAAVDDVHHRDGHLEAAATERLVERHGLFLRGGMCRRQRDREGRIGPEP
jgi:hypothetical protein